MNIWKPSHTWLQINYTDRGWCDNCSKHYYKGNEYWLDVAVECAVCEECATKYGHDALVKMIFGAEEK